MKVERAMGNPKALQVVAAAPELTKEELQKINGLFPSYLFRVRRTKEVWTTCCGKHKTITTPTAEEQKVLDAPHAPVPKVSWGRILNQTPPPVACPYCGKPGTVKEMGRTGGRGNLSAYRRVVALRWYRGSLWARAYQCAKHYNEEHKICAQPMMGLVGVWRFRPGEVKQTCRSYFWWSSSFSPFRYLQQTEGLQKGKWNVHEPFGYSTEEGMCYDVIGTEEAEKSPLRWCGLTKWQENNGRCMRFLTACCFYPRQIEMFMKAGMTDVIRDLTERGVKNANAFRWEETDPVKGFGLTKQELRAFMAGRREIDTVKLYRRLKRMGVQITVERAEQIRTGLAGREREWMALAKKWDISPMKLYRYFERQNKSPQAAMVAWADYVRCGEVLGYGLHRSDVLLPADLGAAHDRAAEEHLAHVQRERQLAERRKKAAEARRLKEIESAYTSLREELEQRYAVELGGFQITVPKNGQEIMDEGRILKHCVAGYAQRHMEGKTVILFMRPVDKPETPFLTIEMDGKKMRQIHGYRNEGMYSAKGRIAPDPREVYRDILDTWLAWVSGGSKRDKNGRPKLAAIKTKGSKTA